jgi:hypothetical protein
VQARSTSRREKRHYPRNRRPFGTVLNSVEHNEHMERKHCQDGKEECGYLIGNICKADRNKPIRITGEIHNALKVVGCSSWSRYLEWEHERTNTVPELPVKQVGDGRDSPALPGSIEGRHPLPMHVLQEGNSGERGNPGIKESSGRDIMTPCDICGKQSIVKESDGHNYCEFHHKLWTKCWTHQRMLLNYKESDDGS